MKVAKLANGPMIGHTTHQGVRLWGRGDGRPGVGVVWTEDGGGRTLAFGLIPELDGIGIVDVGRLFDGDAAEPLVSGYRYAFRMGWLPGADLPEVREFLASGGELDWTSLGEQDFGVFETFPEPGAGVPTRFLLGSCRDPWKGPGKSAFDRIVDAPEVREMNFSLMTGDQVYVDHVKWIDPPPKSLEGYWKVYRKAWGQKNFARTMARLPVYFSFDDHEIQNNWTGGRFRSEAETGFPPERLQMGLRAFEAYQAALGPLVTDAASLDAASFRTLPGGQRYWYRFSHGQSDFFVLDTRFENECCEDFDGEPKILGTRQRRELEAWLTDGSGHVKFIVSAIPVFPDTRGSAGEPADKWGGGVQQRDEILRFLWAEKVPRVVFLSGDVHVSYVSELRNPELDPDYRVHNVVSSAFNWWFLGLQRRHFAFGNLERKNQRGVAVSRDFVSSRWRTDPMAPLVHKKNNYALIEATPEKVLVKFYTLESEGPAETVEIPF